MLTQPVFFSTAVHHDPQGAAGWIRPWREVPLEPRFSGAWVVAGDLDGDGSPEIVSARNVNVGDVHYTSAVVAQRLTGEVLWHWGNPDSGRRGLHHDVACQIHDWDGDGVNEVVLCTDGFLVELDGPTGEERRRLPLPPEATDCLVFANLSGGRHAGDVLVKTRYQEIWAFSYAGKLLWQVRQPGGFPTAHQPFPVDIDGDGRDEIMAGYALLNPDGTVRWTAPNDSGRFTGNGHLDCCRVLRHGATPTDMRLLLTCCGHQRLLALDGTGKVVWEVTGHHFESLDIGHLHPDRPGVQILVDLVPPGGQKEYPIWLLHEDGELLGEFMVDYGRFHTIVDWNNDGIEEIVIPHHRGLFDYRGQRVGTFAMEPQPDPYAGQPHDQGEIGGIVMRGDFTGHGRHDLLITAPDRVCIFQNPAPAQPPTAPPGSHPNFSLY